MRRVATAALVFMASCHTSSNNPPAPAPRWLDGEQSGYLEEGTYLTHGITVNDGRSLIGAGMDKTIIKLSGPSRFVIRSVRRSPDPVTISDLTIDVGAVNTETNMARCGIIGYNWSGGIVERVRVVGLGSFTHPQNPESESFGIILSNCRHSMINDCTVEKNRGGYVSAYCLVGNYLTGSNLVARFSYSQTWSKYLGLYAGVLQAFTLGGGEAPTGSRSLKYSDCYTEGASRGVYCDTGYAVDGLLIEDIAGKLTPRYSVPEHAILLTGQPTYKNIQTNNVTLR